MKHRKYIEIARLVADHTVSTRELAAGFIRYEKIRTLKPHQFTDLWRRNIAGEGKFDDLVDALIEEEP